MAIGYSSYNQSHILCVVEKLCNKEKAHCDALYQYIRQFS